MIKNDNAYDIVGKFDDMLLLYREFDEHSEVQAFDQDLRLRWSRVLDFEKKNAQVLAVVPGDTSFHVIYGYRQKGDYYLKHHHYDPEIKLLDTTTIDVIQDAYFSPKFIVEISEDKEKILLFRIDKEAQLTAIVYDFDKKVIQWAKLMHMQLGSVRKDFRQLLLSNKGDMFLLLDHDKTSRLNKEFLLFLIPAQDHVLRKRQFSLNELTAFDMHAAYDNANQSIMLAGLYNEKNNGRSYGLYTFKLGLNETKPNLHLVRFKEDLIQEVHGKEVSSKKGVNDFLVKETLFRRDGGALLIAESHKEYSRRPNTSVRQDDLSGFGWMDYYFEDVIVFSIHPNGEEHWHTILHKKQYSQDDGGIYSSFFAFKTPEKIRLLYNDEIRLDNTVSEFVLRGNGYYKRESVFSTDYQRLQLRFKDALQVSYNECIVPSEKSGRLNLVQIKFDN